MEEEPPAASKTSQDLDTSLNSSLNVSLNWSGYACILNDGVEIGIQTDPAVPDHPKLCVNKQNATEEVKSAWAWIPSVCGVSVEISRKPSKNCLQRSVQSWCLFVIKRTSRKWRGQHKILRIW